MNYRITKYDPANRDSDGRYAVDDWTSVGDIGKVFAGQPLSLKEYLRMEDAYVAAAIQSMERTGLQAVRMTELEWNGEYDHLPTELFESTQQFEKQLQGRSSIDAHGVEAAVRLVLREMMWCKLVGDHGFYIHFGFDYYMYIGSANTNLADWSVPAGLFVEEVESPYSEATG